jgi:protein-serine/threonine kinase
VPSVSSSQYQVTNPYVSNKHLRIYTIMYDETNADDVAPLVYARDMSSNGTRWNGYPMKGECFLLRDGDVLQILPEFQLKFESAAYTKNSFTPLQVQEMEVSSFRDARSGFRSYTDERFMQLFKNNYNVTQRVLGSGAYGRVHMAYQTATGQQLACKIVDLRKVKERHAAEMEQFLQPEFHASAAGTFLNYKPQSVDEKLATYYREAQLLAKMSHVRYQSLFRHTPS